MIIDLHLLRKRAGRIFCDMSGKGCWAVIDCEVEFVSSVWKSFDGIAIHPVVWEIVRWREELAIRLWNEVEQRLRIEERIHVQR